jgi:hypothetical protein
MINYYIVINRMNSTNTIIGSPETVVIDKSTQEKIDLIADLLQNLS